MNTGWQCPVCQRVFAPHVNECQNCAANIAVGPYRVAPLPAYPVFPTTVTRPYVIGTDPYTFTSGTTCGGSALDCIGRNDGVGKAAFQ